MKINASKVCAVVSTAFLAVGLQAAEVSADSAAVAARRWLQDDAALGCALGAEVDSVRTCSPQGDATFHVVKLGGGGFVVMSSDTTREPVVAFSSGGDLVESDDNPLWVLLKKDLALRAGEDTSASVKKGVLKASATSSVDSGNEAKWSRLLGGGSRFSVKSNEGQSSISDIRVAPLVQSKWNQDNVGGDYCYNYYTPNHYVCGCVATAGAQIMRYFQWPDSSVSVAKFTNTHCAVDGASCALTSQGGYCSWSQMPLEPNSSITDAERQAIGKLTSDIGICVGMTYRSNGSSSGGYMLAEAFTNHYGYASALAMEWVGDISGSDDMKNALLSNFDAGLPVAIGLSDDAGSGHEIVGDGYGYSGDTLYLHFNMGWSGTDNAWYAPPQMAGSQFNFNVLDGFVCNIFTNSAYANGVICSGRVLDATGSPIANAVVSAKKSGSIVKSAMSNANGIYALVLPADSYVLSASSGDSSATTSVTLNSNVGIEIITSGSSFGRYYASPTPFVGNKCGQDITITGVAGVAEPQFNPSSCLFYPSTNVTLSCTTPGATIRYTLDGNDPTESSPVYSGPIFIDDDTMVKARAWKDGLNPSAIVAETYTYNASQGAPKGDYFDNPIVISGESGSRVIDDNSAYTVEEGEPLHTLENDRYYPQYHTIWYKWTAPGSGTMTFATKCSKLSGNTLYQKQTGVAAYTGNSMSSLTRKAFATQPDSSNGYSTTMDVAVEDGVTYYIVGMTMGETATGAFTLTWSGNLTVAQTATSTTEVPVEYDWLGRYFPGRAVADYETIANDDADGDGLATWAEYLLGTDPTNALSRLEATIRMDGTTPVVEGNVDTNRLAMLGYRCSTKGASALGGEVTWSEVNLAVHRFFKLFVEKSSSTD